MLQQSNTKSHWTLLAVARHFEIHGTACRARDLYEHEQLHDTPDRLVATLARLKETGVLDYIEVMSPAKNGNKTRSFAYYPTKSSIENLRDLEEPTALPDGSPVPDEYDTTLPTARVDKGEQPDPPRNNMTTGLEYESNLHATKKNKDYDRSRSTDPDPVDADLTTADGGQREVDETALAAAYITGSDEHPATSETVAKSYLTTRQEPPKYDNRWAARAKFKRA